MEGTKEEQKKLIEDIYNKLGIQIVTCGECGSVILHKKDDINLKCAWCGLESEPCDFPDFTC